MGSSRLAFVGGRIPRSGGREREKRIALKCIREEESKQSAIAHEHLMHLMHLRTN